MSYVTALGTNQPSPATASTTPVTFFAHCHLNAGNSTPSGSQSWFTYGPSSAPGSFETTHAFHDVGDEDYSFSDSASMPADAVSAYEARIFAEGALPSQFGSGTQYFTTNAMVATAGTPASANIQAHQADISCTFFPNTQDSTATVKLEYRKFGDTTWIQAGSSGAYAGYSIQTITRTITGLLANTTYEFRLNMTRTTQNDTTLISNTSSFTTIADVPSITTNAATNIGQTTATLNGTVNPNGLSTTYAFIWGTTLGGPYPNTTATQGPSSGSSAIPYSQAITGLSALTIYYYKAKATAGGVDYFGSEVSFTTAASATAARIHPIMVQAERKYGVTTNIYFAVETPSVTGSNHFFNAAAPWVTGDVTISKDGGAFANTTNLPTRIDTSQGLFKLTLTASEMSGTYIQVLISDQSAVSPHPLWRDFMVTIQTKWLLGQMDVAATVIGGNTDAMKLLGVGSGLGINANGGATASGDFGRSGSGGGLIPYSQVRAGLVVASAGSNVTLDGNASSLNNFYTGCVVTITSGSGSGQARMIVGYDGQSKVATVNRAWNANPGVGAGFVVSMGDDTWATGLVELTAIPTTAGVSANKLQLVYQRSAFKRTRSLQAGSSVQGTDSFYKSDSSTVIWTEAWDDGVTTGSTFTIAKGL